ncbi:cell division control protein 6 homolog isoform 2-T2 [Spinachia spinachia]
MASTRSAGRAQPTLPFPRRKSCRAPPAPKAALPRLGPLSPKPPAAHPSPLPPRLPLSPRKRTGDDNGCNLGADLRGSPPKQSKPTTASPRKPEDGENSAVPARRRLVPPSSPCKALRPSAGSPPRRQETPTRSPTRQKSDRKPPVVRLFGEKSRFLSAKQALHTAAPERLLSREAERGAIRSFLEEKALRRLPGSLYISGAPGTGKTACLTCVLHEMTAALAPLQTVLVNCMSLRSSHGIFPLLADKLKAPGGPSGLQRFLTAPGPPVLLVLDEMDQLDSKAQDVLYTVFEWPYLPESRLCLVGVANALDLTDRILPRLQARPHCRPLLLHFPPYSRQELADIVQDRLAGVSRVPCCVCVCVCPCVQTFNNPSSLLRRRLTGSSTPRPFSSVPVRCRRCRETPGRLWTSAGTGSSIYLNLPAPPPCLNSSSADGLFFFGLFPQAGRRGGGVRRAQETVGSQRRRQAPAGGPPPGGARAVGGLRRPHGVSGRRRGGRGELPAAAEAAGLLPAAADAQREEPGRRPREAPRGVQPAVPAAPGVRRGSGRVSVAVRPAGEPRHLLAEEGQRGSTHQGVPEDRREGR